MKLIDGKLVSENVYLLIKDRIQTLKENNIIPGLAVVLIGDRTDSQTYVRMKQKKCEELGIKSILVKLDTDISEDDVINNIIKLNQDISIHGILVQLPLPKHLDESKILSQISLEKDVDGFHCENIGKLALNKNPTFIPCTPNGCMELLHFYNIDLAGKHVVILGRSNIVGLPLSLLLLHQNATVTICHSKTKDIKKITQTADILIAACGKMEIVKKDWLKPGVDIIDIGINTKTDLSKKRGYKLVGDVDFEDVKDVVNYITPVPGGVGPMTIATLMYQTVESASQML